jgi:hypothetical protein
MWTSCTPTTCHVGQKERVTGAEWASAVGRRTRHRDHADEWASWCVGHAGGGIGAKRGGGGVHAARCEQREGIPAWVCPSHDAEDQQGAHKEPHLVRPPHQCHSHAHRPSASSELVPLSACSDHSTDSTFPAADPQRCQNLPYDDLRTAALCRGRGTSARCVGWHAGARAEGWKHFPAVLMRRGGGRRCV